MLFFILAVEKFLEFLNAVQTQSHGLQVWSAFNFVIYNSSEYKMLIVWIRVYYLYSEAQKKLIALKMNLLFSKLHCNSNFSLTGLFYSVKYVYFSHVCAIFFILFYKYRLFKSVEWYNSNVFFFFFSLPNFLTFGYNYWLLFEIKF